MTASTAIASQIRTLFLHPHPTYTIPEAAALLGMGWRDVRAWMEAGELEGVDTDQGLVLPWAELMSFGMDFWSQEAVEEALGAEPADVRPELLRLTDLEVRIPRMEVVALERVAARDGQSVSTRARARVARLRVGALGLAVGGGARVRAGTCVAGGQREVTWSRTVIASRVRLRCHKQRATNHRGADAGGRRPPSPPLHF
jgi:hypothetical protein